MLQMEELSTTSELCKKNLYQDEKCYHNMTEKGQDQREHIWSFPFLTVSSLLSNLPVVVLYQTLSMSCTISHTAAFLLGLDEDLVNDCIQLSIFDCCFKYCRRTEWSSFVLWDTKKWALQSKKVSGLLMLYGAEAGKNILLF